MKSVFLHKHRFTLIELLVVISIIAILASMLLPALGAAKKMAQRSACSGNVKQLCLAMIQYESDFQFLPKMTTDALGIAFQSILGFGAGGGQLAAESVRTFYEDYLRAGTGTVSGANYTITNPSKSIKCPAAYHVYPFRSDASRFDYSIWGADAPRPTFTVLTKVAARYTGTMPGSGVALWSDLICAYNNGNYNKPQWNNHNQQRKYGDGGNIGYIDGSVRWAQPDLNIESNLNNEWERAQNVLWSLNPRTAVRLNKAQTAYVYKGQSISF